MDMIHWAVDSEIPVLALLTKADKLSQGKRSAEVLKVKKELAKLNGSIKVQAFSSLKRTGTEQATAVIRQWFSPELASEE